MSPMPPAQRAPQMPGIHPETPGRPGQVYASWIQRVTAHILNLVPAVAVYVGGFILSKIVGVVLDFLGLLILLTSFIAALAVTAYVHFLDGEDQSPGKAIVGIRVVNESSGRSLGGLMGVGRLVIHILDSVPCGLGWFLPLVDKKRQTIADKVLGTVVVQAPKVPMANAYRTLIPKLG